MKHNILGVCFDNLTLDEAAQAGAALLDDGGFHYVVTPNPEFILSAEKDEEFRTILNKADLVLPDGYIDTISAIVRNKIRYCDGVLDADYFRYLFETEE